MEIKRRLTKIAKSLSPQIEVMNVASEMNRMCERFEELVRYAQEKIDRSAERKKMNQPTIGKQADDARKAADKEVSDHQTEEADENLKDQQESFEERNKILDKSQKPEDSEASTVSDAMQNQDGEVIDGDTEVPTAAEAPPVAKKKAKKTGRKKASKKK